MGLDYICDRIDELEELKRNVQTELEELYELRQELWEEERKQADWEYERSAM